MTTTSPRLSCENTTLAHRLFAKIPKNCLKSAGIKADVSCMVEGDHTLDGGRDAMQRILALKHSPTAIMCSNDMTAIGVQHALFDAGFKVPADFSLIGFDDIHLAEYTIPPLTTVRMSCKDLAKSAIGALLSSLDRANIMKSEALNKISPRLIVRQTTDLPRNALSDLNQNPKSKRRSR